MNLHVIMRSAAASDGDNGHLIAEDPLDLAGLGCERLGGGPT